MPVKLTTEKFIEKARLIHGDKYDYSLVNYINSRTKVKIICNEHGVFEQNPRGHLVGQKCIKCFVKNRDFSSIRKSTQENFIEKSKEVHGDRYDYSLVNYKNSQEEVEIICSKHGIFKQKPVYHINNKSNCPNCAMNIRHHKTRKSDDFITKSKEVHGDKYDYSNVVYKNRRSNVEIICKKHGHFSQTPGSHINGYGCNKCGINSIGENKLLNIFESKKIKYLHQHTFDNCKNIRKLPFDFYLEEHNVCVEFHGKQHFEPIDYFGGILSFKKQLKSDLIKEKYCKENKISLIILYKIGNKTYFVDLFSDSHHEVLGLFSELERAELKKYKMLRNK